MATWQDSINITDVHRLYEDDRISLEGVGKIVAFRLKRTVHAQSNNTDILNIINQLETLNESNCIDDYDAVLDMLYDFGNSDHKLWIETLVEAKNVNVAN